MYNKVTLIGTLGKNPEIKEVNGKRLANLSVATWESRQNPNGEWVKDATWHTVTVWNNAVKMIEEAMQGDLVFVEGKLTSRNYKDETNEVRKINGITGFVRVLKRKNANNAAHAETHAAASQTAQSPMAGFDDDDLPF